MCAWQKEPAHEVVHKAQLPEDLFIYSTLPPLLLNPCAFLPEDVLVHFCFCVLHVLFLCRLLAPGGGVSAVLVNERGAEQRMAPLLAKRGVVVVKLLDQVIACLLSSFTR
jgi:hypothetical protein